MTLEEQKKVMADYMRLKIDEQDWHGVSDAANDLRELEIQDQMEAARSNVLALSKDLVVLKEKIDSKESFQTNDYEVIRRLESACNIHAEQKRKWIDLYLELADFRVSVWVSELLRITELCKNKKRSRETISRKVSRLVRMMEHQQEESKKIFKKYKLDVNCL